MVSLLKSHKSLILLGTISNKILKVNDPGGHYPVLRRRA
jgi:hypothetical protein